MKYLAKEEDGVLRIVFQTDSRSLPRGTGYRFIEGVDTKYPVIHTDENGELSVIEDIKPKLIQAAYDEMVEDIYSEMLNVFGTRNDVSAAAFAATWEAMLNRPANYVDALLGLLDDASVIAYANSKLAASDVYGVFRLQRIGLFQSTKASILAGE